MLGSTLNAYKKTYNKRLSDHVKDYIDNDEDSFLEKELMNFEDYYYDLKFTLDYLKNLSNKGVKDEARVMSVLKKLNSFHPIPYTFEFKNYLNRNNKNTFKLSHDFPHENKLIKSINNLITSTKRIIDFINDEKTKLQKSNTPENIIDFKDDSTYGNPKNKINPYPQVFLNNQAFELFEKLHETYKDTKTPIADYSFIYRMMYEDGYILEHFKPGMYRNWLSKHYEIELDKLKTIHECTKDSRIQNYNTIKELLQIK